MDMTIYKAAQVSKGRLAGTNIADRTLAGVTIDSRAVKEGDLFVAYRGERVDGHDYINKAFQNGAACCLAERAPEDAQGPVIVVGDVQEALESICTALRESLSLPIVGVTGSMGKTSAKEMIWAVLAQRMNVLKTEGNLNNQIGVPMTLSRIRPEHEAAVVEMGISGFGEMRKLGQMVRPHIAVYTAIGHAHLEFLHDLDGVLRAKTEMLDYVDKDGLVIINGDDRKLREIRCVQRLMSVGLGEDCDVRAEDVCLISGEKTACTIRYGERKIEAVIPAYGRHMVYAALEGAAVGFAMGLSDEEIRAGIAAYKTVGGRGAITETGYVTVIDDSYNANPEAMHSAIDSLAERKGRKVCIFGDMLEMGEDSESLHREVGRYAAEKGMDLVVACGEEGRIIAQSAGQAGRYFAGGEEIIRALPELIKQGDTVLIKASRRMHFETIAEAVKGLGEKDDGAIQR